MLRKWALVSILTVCALWVYDYRRHEWVSFGHDPNHGKWKSRVEKREDHAVAYVVLTALSTILVCAWVFMPRPRDN